jgi:galacturan 1,4-alpha-galacturonidase
MRLSICLAAFAAAAGATAKSCLSRRPQISPSPHEPRLPIQSPPKRHKVCVVETHGDGVTDDSSFILSAFHECNDGGHVLFARDSTYMIGTAMDWTFLKHIDIGMTSCSW